MIKDILKMGVRLEDPTSGSVEDVLELNKILRDYAEKGKELVLRSVKESDFAELRLYISKFIAIYMLVKGDQVIFTAAQDGQLFEYTDTVVFAMIGILYEEGVL